VKQIHINVIGDPGRDMPLLTVDNGASYIGRIEGARCSFQLADTEPTGHGASIFSGVQSVRVIVPPEGSWEADLPPVKPPESTTPIVLRYGPTLKRLHVSDDALVDDDGQRIVLGLSTDFQLFELFLAGDAPISIDGVLEQRAAAGAQGFRVFGTCDFLFKLDPRQWPAYYTALTDFAAMLAREGLYLQFTAMADAQHLHDFDQQDHWQRCCDALADSPNVILELANENQQNGVDASQFTKPERAPLVSSGSFCDGWTPTGSWGDLVTFHPRRDQKWWYTVPATVQELRDYPGQHKPVWIGEPIGAADQNEPGRRANDPALFEKLGAGIGIFSAGGVFHSQSGLTSQLWTPREEECARAFFRGLHR
jgi:hypothetical protein